MPGLTPFQTIGPYFQVMLADTPRGVDTLVSADTPGERITIEGAVLDGNSRPVPDSLVEIWQADAEGRYRHPDDPREAEIDEAGDWSFNGFGRVSADQSGRFKFETIKPGRVPGPDGKLQAPHILVSLLARGVLTRYWTRLYFDGEPSNSGDPVLAVVPAARRETLIAAHESGGRFHFDLVIQGPRETVFFDA
jgi:protocatechuate 3,4-dioxygenase alpha subunit